MSQLLQLFGTGRIVALLLLLDWLIIRIWDPTPLEALRHNAFDVYQIVQPRPAANESVVIVDIDEASLEAFGQWPWPRTIVADLVDAITKSGAAIIAFDVLFPEPDRTSPGITAAASRGLDEETRERLRKLRSNDDILADAIRGSKVVLGQSGYRNAALKQDSGRLEQTGLVTVGVNPRRYVVSFPHLLRNIPQLEEAAQGRGLFSIKAEPDGMVRRVPLIALAGGVMVSSLALDVIRLATGSGAIIVKAGRAGVEWVGVQGLEIPTDPKGRTWIHFARYGPDKYISALQLLQGKVAPERLAGKIVLVGTSAVGLFDLKTTPVNPAMPGVELHAQILESVTAGATLNRPAYTTLIELGAAAVLSLVLIVLAPNMGGLPLFMMGGVIAASIVVLSLASFERLHLLLDYTFPLISSFSVYLVLVFTNYVQAAADRRQIRSAFSQYISPALVEQLARSPEKLVLGGERREMTVMFSDLRGFTAVAESYQDDPHGLTTLMNRLLTPLTNIVIDRKGTIDKYMGDCIMAFWNAPLADPAHELNACDAALAMVDCLAKLNEERAREAAEANQLFLPLKMGIGLNSGPCVVGNMGSDLHFNYSVLGDTVNLSSRLESQSARYGVPIVVGEQTARAVSERLAVLELDRLRMKGKSRPERIFTILGHSDVAASSEFERLATLNRTMLSSYRSRDWTKALETIILCREAGRGFGLDEYYALFVTRIRSLIDVPPPAQWEGVTVLDTK
jgi:adenylate cyclase